MFLFIREGVEDFGNRDSSRMYGGKKRFVKVGDVFFSRWVRELRFGLVLLICFVKGGGENTVYTVISRNRFMKIDHKV